MRGGREVTRGRQERLRPGSQGVGDASGFDSRPAPVERRRGKEGRGRRSGGAQTIGAASYGEGRGPETRHQRGGVPVGQPGVSRSASRGSRRAPGSAAAAVSYRLGLLFFAQLSGCPGPSREANRTASPGLRHRPPPRQRSRREQDRREPEPQRGLGPEVAPGREQVRALKPARCPLPSPPQPPPPPPPASPDATPGPATSATRDAPEAGLGASRDARGLGAGRAADWRAALGGGALRQLADRWLQGPWLATEERGPRHLIGSCEVFNLWEMRPKPTEC